MDVLDELEEITIHAAGPAAMDGVDMEASATEERDKSPPLAAPVGDRMPSPNHPIRLRPHACARALAQRTRGRSDSRVRRIMNPEIPRVMRSDGTRTRRGCYRVLRASSYEYSSQRARIWSTSATTGQCLFGTVNVWTCVTRAEPLTELLNSPTMGYSRNARHRMFCPPSRGCY